METIKVETSVRVPLARAWELWTVPHHIEKWNHASDDWHTPSAENDLRTGGKFLYRMEAKNGSYGFDFGGIYDKVIHLKEIFYTIGDGRKVKVTFTRIEDQTRIEEVFEAETENTPELQQNGWQSILDNFRKYAESR